MRKILLLCLIGAIAIGCEKSETELKATMYKLTVSGMAEPIGDVKFRKTNTGDIEMVVTMKNVTPGPHGIHVHAGRSCGPNGPDGKRDRGLAALGHYDPFNAGHHAGPNGDGHAGDLPLIFADSNGNIDEIFILSRFSLQDIQGHAIVVHDEGDNYSDTPKPLGGGGGRFACGILE